MKLDVLIMLDELVAQHYVDRAAARLTLAGDEGSLRLALVDLDCALIVDGDRVDVVAERARVRSVLGEEGEEAS